MGTERKTRHGKMLVEKQEWFVRLIAQGVSNAQACRIVGINRRTGTRWRYGRTILNKAGEQVHYPAVSLAEHKPRHPRYLSLAERTTIADLHRAGVSVCAVAEELGRAASTVSRELRRNADDQGRYLPATAQRLTVERQSRPSRTRRVARDEQLHGVVADVMTPDPHMAPADITVEDFIHRYLLGDRHSAYPVADRDGSIIGLITLAQLRGIAPSQRAATLVREAAIPLPRVPTAAPHEPLTVLLERLGSDAGNRALVVDEGRLAGIVTASDLSRLIDVYRLASPQADVAYRR
ncbi:CBS domain-containing protein [Candidatus Mycobacterium methanotrophicum]|uniref:CBS domain-containing protein n=1 Tax=Candidatus Mycobacterium methanotrophicum TaxID=2943498 RepID=A0ABY4QL02_9MYCO|nr:CBS domain-containing protein [Candidatus Mycobacterium methanotrophicum]UQX10345.1 CBS domain-containing protein [Candidatus Mycobacterium methanotrophicum]